MDAVTGAAAGLGQVAGDVKASAEAAASLAGMAGAAVSFIEGFDFAALPPEVNRSEEHTSELQSRRDLVCRLLLEKKKSTIAPARLFRRHTSTISSSKHWEVIGSTPSACCRRPTFPMVRVSRTPTSRHVVVTTSCL